MKSTLDCVCTQAGNILIDHRGQVILADMGVAAAMARSHLLHERTSVDGHDRVSVHVHEFVDIQSVVPLGDRHAGAVCTSWRRLHHAGAVCMDQIFLSCSNPCQ